MKMLVVHGHRDPGCIRISAECKLRAYAAAKERANVLVLSGAGVAGERSEATQMAAIVLRVPGSRFDRVLLEQHSTCTQENARNSMRHAVRLGATNVVVVTSWWHVPRAWLEWRRLAMPGIRVTFKPTWGSPRYVPRELGALWRWR